FFGASPTEPLSLIQYDVRTKATTVIKRSVSVPLSKEVISVGEAIAFPTTHGETSYAFYYPPKNPRAKGPVGELPPLVVKCHGGPTAHVQNGLSLETQYWTSRGFAVVDVNYGGSSGYGRAYRDRLNQNWGVVDVADCVNAARWLADQGEVDGRRMAIRGGSAGGYCTLCALTFFPGVFGAGA